MVERKEIMQQLMKVDNLDVRIQQKAESVTRYIETQSITRVSRFYQARYGEVPTVRRKIVWWVANFSSEGNVENRTGRGKPTLNQETINMFHSYFKQNPSRSVKGAERGLPIHYSRVRKILKNLVLMFPNEIITVQNLGDDYKLKRVEFSQQCN